jgi:hypothetical protein
MFQIFWICVLLIWSINVGGWRFPISKSNQWSTAPKVRLQGVKQFIKGEFNQLPIVPDLKNVPFKMKDVISTNDIDAVRFRHIQVATKELALECHTLWETGKMDFDRLAKTLSMCESTKGNGGDSGWVYVNEESIFPSELINECCHMTKGDVSIISVTGEPKLNQTTWHVLQLVDIMMKLNWKDFTRKKEVLRQKTSRSTIKTYTIDTMGCQMNVADSERMEAQLASIGFEKANHSHQANVVIVNTCSIRDHAEQKVYSHLGPHAMRKKNGEDVTIVVSGCVAQQEGENLIRRFPGIDVVMGPQYSNRVVDLLESVLDGHQVVATDPSYQAEDTIPALRKSDISAFVNVIYGCNEHCTYCVVPNTRGVEQSRTKEAIVKEVQDLVVRGYKEVTLLGQNIDAWGR